MWTSAIQSPSHGFTTPFLLATPLSTKPPTHPPSLSSENNASSPIVSNNPQPSIFSCTTPPPFSPLLPCGKSRHCPAILSNSSLATPLSPPAPLPSQASSLAMDTASATTARARERVFCHECRGEWLRDEHGLVCPNETCHSDFVEIVSPSRLPISCPQSQGSTRKRLPPNPDISI